MTRRRPALILVFILCAGGVLAVAATPNPTPSATSGPGIDLAGIDKKVPPGQDFFAHANGTWLRTTEIPPDRAAYGASGVVSDLTSQRTAEIIEQAARAGAPAGSTTQKIGDYYASLLDQPTTEEKGLRPLEPTLARIAAIGSREDLSRFLGGTVRADVDALNATNYYTDNVLGLWVAQDLEDPSRYVPFLMQGGLDMPDRQYYVDPAPRMADLRAKYREHVSRMLELAGLGDVAARTARILDLEGRIAQAHWTRQDSDDVKKANNHWARAEFDRAAPGLDWREFFTAAGLEGQPVFAVWQPSAVTGISALAASQPLEAWKDYLTFHALEHFGSVLPKGFGEERFRFHGTVLAGIPQRRELRKRAVEATSDALGEAVGQLYVQRHFPPEAKARVEEMVRNLMAAFDRRIDALAWMAPATKATAKAKLAALKVGVGYPDKWTDYSALAIVRGDAFGNADRLEKFEYRRQLAKLGQPVDRSEWVMTPQTVNAVNLPVMNAMNFPAAMLQPPYFDPSRPVAMDYGAIGAVIGHEVSHSFDDQGSQFDEKGRLRNWWTEEDRAHFDASSAQLVKQYDAYRPFPDLAVSGSLTLSENIADVAGLAAAYDAYRLSLGGRPAPVVAGLSGDQQFFLSFAQSWRLKMREAALRQQVVQDGHAPDEYRANTVRNLDQWYAAFDVRPGMALYLPPEQRVRVW